MHLSCVKINKGGNKMTIEEDIKRILDNDEEIIKTYRPNRKRFVFINFCLTCLFFLIPIGVFIFGVLGLSGVVSFVNEAGEREFGGPIGLMAFGGFGLLILAVHGISLFVRYKKTYYIVSNKRLIIRTGFIGADYKSIPLETVGVVDVRVDFLDKLVKNDTGTIVFGSASSPVVNRENTIFAFSHIDNPYQSYKEVKEIISNKQNEKVS